MSHKEEPSLITTKQMDTFKEWFNRQRFCQLEDPYNVAIRAWRAARESFIESQLLEALSDLLTIHKNR